MEALQFYKAVWEAFDEEGRPPLLTGANALLDKTALTKATGCLLHCFGSIQDKVKLRSKLQQEIKAMRVKGLDETSLHPALRDKVKLAMAMR